jgi:hypothetical protein
MGRLALGIVVALGWGAVTGVEAQGPAGRGGGGGQGAMMMTADLGRVLEVALANRDALALSPDQVTQLNGLKTEVDVALAPIREELGVLRAGAGRGGMGGRGGPGAPQGGDRQAVMATLQKAQELTSPHRVRYEEITTAAQREALLPLLRRPPGGR